MGVGWAMGNGWEMAVRWLGDGRAMDGTGPKRVLEAVECEHDVGRWTIPPIQIKFKDRMGPCLPQLWNNDVPHYAIYREQLAG